MLFSCDELNLEELLGNIDGGETKIQLSITPSKITLPAKGGSATFAITAPQTWSATSSEFWLTASPSAGVSGEQVVTVTAEPNTADARQATVKVECGGVSATLTVLQEAEESTPPVHETILSINPTSVTFDCDGGEASIGLEANGEWKANTGFEWIKVSPASGNGSATVKVQTAKNNSVEDLRGTVLFTSGDKTVSLSVVLAGRSNTDNLEDPVNGDQWEW